MVSDSGTAVNPGSKEALAIGCKCPVLDNGYGKGVYGGLLFDDGKPKFWIASNCPIHNGTSADDGELFTPDMQESEGIA